MVGVGIGSTTGLCAFTGGVLMGIIGIYDIPDLHVPKHLYLYFKY